MRRGRRNVLQMLFIGAISLSLLYQIQVFISFEPSLPESSNLRPLLQQQAHTEDEGVLRASSSVEEIDTIPALTTTTTHTKEMVIDELTPTTHPPVTAATTATPEAVTSEGLASTPPPPTSSYTCSAWHQTTQCSPYSSVKEPQISLKQSASQQSCEKVITSQDSGYCEITQDNSLLSTAHIWCQSLPSNGPVFTCAKYAVPFYTYATRALAYVPPVAPTKSIKRGIIIAAYDKVMTSVYASIKLLRYYGCVLPIELWALPGELTKTTAALVTALNVTIRLVDEEAAKDIHGWFVKPYSLTYTAFEQVLVLDADNVALRDPTYLFDSKEFVTTGAIFFKDYWQPSQSMFGLTSKSLIWELTRVDFVDEFEQESGQLVVNTRTHKKALSVLMFLARTYDEFIKPFKLLHGDKDLFRFAWRMANNASFHYVTSPPASVGWMESNFFCGNSMIQHDPTGEPIFFHRNMPKLHFNGGDNIWWSHMKRYVGSDPQNDYRIGYSWDRVNRFGSKWHCFSGKETPAFKVVPIADTEYRDVEKHLLRFAKEAKDFITLS